jgi:hypothetical protein
MPNRRVPRLLMDVSLNISLKIVAVYFSDTLAPAYQVTEKTDM